MRSTRGLRSKSGRLIAAVLVTGLTAAALAVLYGGAEQHARARAMRQALATPGGGTEPGEVSLKKVEQFWQTRLTYPTGRFDQRWVNAAAKQAKRVKVGIPKGLYRTRSGKLVRSTGVRSGAQAVEALSAAKPLGPQPQASTGCQAPCFTFGLVSGRINAIAFDPKNPSIAYVAQDGGGIWKSTNCCTPFTMWTVTTDAPNVPTTATDDVTVDPNNSNVVYAATGDLSFGSFAFGSAGVLKSTDAGATWQTLGAKGFTPAEPARDEGLHAGGPGRERRHVPAVPGGLEGARRPEQQQQRRCRDEDRSLLLVRRRRQLERAAPDEQVLYSTSGRQRPEPPPRRRDDLDLRGRRRARVRHVRPAEPRPE